MTARIAAVERVGETALGEIPFPGAALPIQPLDAAAMVLAELLE